MKQFSIVLIPLLLFAARIVNAKEQIPLNGIWQFAIDSLDRGIDEQWFNNKLMETVSLPGSMTENGKGNDISLLTRWTGDILDSSYFKLQQYENYRQPGNIKIPFWLQPEKYYSGAAWYRKEIIIPAGWNEKSITIFFERCHWQSSVWVDNRYIGSKNALGAPHIYEITENLTPGKHTITVRMDNRIQEIQPGVNSSSITDHSQTNWNGIVGKMFLQASDKIYIRSMKIFSDKQQKSVSVNVRINNRSGKLQKVNLAAQATGGKLPLKRLRKEYELIPGENAISFDYAMGNTPRLWDEFSPNLYTMVCSVSNKLYNDSKEETFGLRSLATKKTQFTVNDRLIYLRGTLECAVFPKTGYPPTDEKEWTRIFKVCKEYGLNHMRFHSWCPPEAAFTAADRVGIYLYVECSSWANQGAAIGDGKPIDQFIFDESERIVEEYGNHPSFCFLVYGNEPGGEKQNTYLTKFVSDWKKKDTRRLYSSASGWPQLDVNDFHSMYEPRIQLWGAGLNSIINSQSPSSNYDWYNIINWRGKPVISHEIGQWCVYPKYDEIKKYDGVLKAKNFEIFQERLIENGMGDLAKSFLNASGKLQVLCYKAEIEAALRTKEMGGFQLLDLHDFPGQGTALIGVLDPFWESKGYVTPAEYTQFCNATVPLARLSKYIFNSAEDFKAAIEISHFGENTILGVTPTWQIIDATGAVTANGQLSKTDIPIGNGFRLGEIRFPLNTIKSPAMYTIKVSVNGFENHWDFWVYPYQNQPVAGEKIKIVRQMDSASIDFLRNGGSVLLTPEKGSIKKEFGGDVAVGFSSIFWNTAWTNKQPPHTLGILCDPKHPLFNHFPTQYHSNYQWWDAMSHSNAILLDSLGVKIQPLVRIIDDWFTNRALGLIVEAKVGNGKIIISGIDLFTDAEKRPEARQLTFSIFNYMQSTAFNPTQEISLPVVTGLFHSPKEL